MRAIILANEEKSRMKSNLPKILNDILGKSMIQYCLDTLKETNLFKEIFILADAKQEAISEAMKPIECINLEGILSNFKDKDEDVFVMFGDSPFVSPETVTQMKNKHEAENNYATFITVAMFVKASGISAVACKGIDISVQGFLEEGKKLNEMALYSPLEPVTINTKKDIHEVIKTFKRTINDKHMINGVTIINTEQTYISPDTVIGSGTIIYPGTFIYGKTVIGENNIIGPDAFLTNMTIGDNNDIKYSNALDSSIGSNSHIGPYAYIRPNSQIGSNVKVGDFVEIKNSVIGDDSKASHLTYVGDAVVGQNVNFGCGTITVNYDGSSKFKTQIKDNAFIGCNTNLVAPVTVNENSYIAAGSTITDDVPEKSLAIARARQVNKVDWLNKN